MFNDILSRFRSSQSAVVNVAGNEFERLIQEKSDAQLIDVRTPGEFHQGHIPGALNYDMYDPAFAGHIEALDRSRPVLLYCRSGSRSYHAGSVLVKLGFGEVYNLADGLFDWSGALER
ncbi:MAG TPA: rhodanese-like domain-containing protein [Bacteroidota bacterium]|nr:rhodanese-like domain-containing protein [Bacteroidota bacterium]